MSKSIAIVEKKLQRHRSKHERFVYGQADEENGVAEIEPRQPMPNRLDAVLHEGLHLIFPDLSERVVASAAKKLKRLLWKDRWRRMDHPNPK